MTKILSAALAAVLLSPFAASAQDARFHIGVAAGGELEERGPFDDPDDVDGTRSLYGGATFDGGFGVEAAYVDLGDIDEIGIADGGYHLEGELWSVGATYTVRLDAFAPYAKLGWFSRDEDGIAIGIAGPTPLSIGDDGLTAEVGARWHLGESFALRGGWVHYDFETGGDDHLQLGVEYHF